MKFLHTSVLWLVQFLFPGISFPIPFICYIPAHLLTHRQHLFQETSLEPPAWLPSSLLLQPLPLLTFMKVPITLPNPPFCLHSFVNILWSGTDLSHLESSALGSKLLWGEEAELLTGLITRKCNLKLLIWYYHFWCNCLPTLFKWRKCIFPKFLLDISFWTKPKT